VSDRRETRAIRSGRDANHGSIASPIWPSTAYELRDLAESARLASAPRSTEFYARNGTPTAQAFADAVAEVEGAEAGIAFGSGMGAAATIVFGLCSPGDRIVAQASMFSVTSQLLTRTCDRFGIRVDLVDAFDAGALRDAVAAEEQRRLHDGDSLAGVAEPSPEQQAAEERRQQRYDAAVTALSDAQGRLTRALEAFRPAAGRCADAIRDAAEHGKDGRWDNVKGALRDVADWARLDVVVKVLGVIAVAIAVVAIVVVVMGVILGARVPSHQ